MITFSNGNTLDFACAAGALSFDGHGWPHEYPFRWLGLLRPQEMTVVAKTITLKPTIGNFQYLRPWRSVRYIGDGSFVNAIGNTNPGMLEWVKKYLFRLEKWNFAVSLEPHSIQDAITFRIFFEDYVSFIALKPARLRYLELNASCPNTNVIDGNEHVISLATQLANKNRTYLPLIVKLSYTQAHDESLLKELSKINGVEAIHVINTIPWKNLKPDAISPVAKHTKRDGGISGTLIKEHALETVKFVKSILPEMPVVGGGGISTLEDVYQFEEAGANAFSIGSLFIRAPWKPNQIIRAYRKA